MSFLELVLNFNDSVKKSNLVDVKAIVKKPYNV